MRDLTPGMAAEVVKNFLRPVLFCYIEFLSGPVYLWSGVGSISWNGQTWMGVGKFGAIGPMQETEDVAATNLALSLSGVPSDLLGYALTEVRQGKQCRVWLGAVDANLNIIVDPYESFSGRLDICAIDEGPDTSTVSITVENVLIDMQRARPVFYTDQAQQAEFPGDKGFEFVPQLQEKSLRWGAASASIGGGGGGGSTDGGGHGRLNTRD
jgi:hypothetical protein